MRRKALLIALTIGVLALVGGPAPASADDIDLGLAGQYAVFGLGSTMTIGTSDTLLNNTAEIYGSVAVGADTGSLTATGNGTFQKGFMTGDLVVDGPTTPASYTVKKDFDVIGTVQGTTPAQFGVTDVTGTGTFNLVTAVQAAIDRSAFYAGLAPTGTISGNAISLNSANQTVNAGVYNITGFSMNSGSILTINGSATDKFVLNISGAFSFDKSFIQLTGGITSANVLFNVTGNDSTATGTAKITGDNSVFFGTLLAVGRNIDIEGIGSHNGSTQGVGCGADGLCDTADDNPGLEGRVIGALGTTANPLLLKVFSGAEVDFPGTPVPEPITMFLGGTGLLTLAYAARKRLFPRPV